MVETYIDEKQKLKILLTISGDVLQQINIGRLNLNIN